MCHHYAFYDNNYYVAKVGRMYDLSKVIVFQCALIGFDRVLSSYIFIYIAGEAFGAASEELDEQSENQLGRVVLGAHQQERLLKFLDVKLQ